MISDHYPPVCCEEDDITATQLRLVVAIVTRMASTPHTSSV